MSNRELVKQAREGISYSIAENPSVITIARKPLVDNGFGVMVEDPFGTPVDYTFTVRLSSERKGPATVNESSNGFSSNLGKMITIDYNSGVLEGDVFTAEQHTYKCGVVTPLFKFGSVIGYQAPLYDAGG